jgi:hypothetical protein
MTAAVAELLQVVAVCNPYSCCNVQHWDGRGDFLPMTTPIARSDKPCNNSVKKIGSYCRLKKELLQPVAGFVVAPFSATPWQLLARLCLADMRAVSRFRFLSAVRRARPVAMKSTFEGHA